MRGTECEINKGLTSRPHGSERDDRSSQLQSRRRASRAAQCGQQSGQVTDEIVATEGRKMGLHTKNREAHLMAEELAKLTGETSMIVDKFPGSRPRVTIVPSPRLHD